MTTETKTYAMGNGWTQPEILTGTNPQGIFIECTRRVGFDPDNLPELNDGTYSLPRQYTHHGHDSQDARVIALREALGYEDAEVVEYFGNGIQLLCALGEANNTATLAMKRVGLAE